MPSSLQKRRSPDSPLKKRRSRWLDLWLKKTQPLKYAVDAKQLSSLSPLNKEPKPKFKPTDIHIPEIHDFSKIDRTVLLSDDLLLKILTKLPRSQRNSNSLVCKRWLSLHGRLLWSIKVLDWKLLDSGRLISRFPNLTHVDLVNACLVSPQNSGILLNHKAVSVHVNPVIAGDWQHISDDKLLATDIVDKGLKKLARGFPNLCKLVVLNASELGLLNLAEECLTLQELELHKCSDKVLRGIAACENLQILRIVGNLSGLYSSSVSDMGLTILAQGCTRLVKLELSGCEGSFDGIKAIGQCCQMLEELTFSDHRMSTGWLAALSYCENLKTLKLLSCKRIDQCPAQDEDLGCCSALERLHLEKCHLRDKKSARALFRICEAVREVDIQDCPGLSNEVFSRASAFRRVKLLSLEGCTLLTTEGLESVILSWNELETLKLVSCKNIKDSEISPALSSFFCLLKELQWRADTRSRLAASLEGTGMGKRGGRFFKKKL